MKRSYADFFGGFRPSTGFSAFPCRRETAMEKRTRNIMVAAAMAGLALAAGTSRAADRQGPAIVLHWTNHARTPLADVLRAQAEAERIFGAIGVRVVWVDGATGPEHRACEGLNLFLSLASPAMIEELSSQGARDNVLGSAPRGVGRIFIYVERVRRRAAESLLDERVLLGRVIAHEIGHQVLPGSGHSAAGIMVAGINANPVGVGFTPQESRTIRALLESRASQREERTTCGN
jgi:hypothetical protein